MATTASCTTWALLQAAAAGDSMAASSFCRFCRARLEDTFLKLLMAQMTHQDPMQPTDSAQMLSQLAQFANVEGINKLNKQTTSLNLGQDFAGSVAMIGKTVTWLDSEGAAHTGVVDAVKPSPSGALLVIDAEEVPSGAVRKVE